MRDLLDAGLEKLGLEAETETCIALLSYIELLEKWNEAYNLTAIKDPKEILNRHIFDSISVSTHIKGQNCIDIGTGAGLPGLILALVQPERHWVLLDSNLKKIRFLRHVKSELGIDNVELVHSRIEQFQSTKEFNTLICRAFAPLPRILELVDHLLTDTNYLFAMKGKQFETELSQISNHNLNIEVEHIAFFEDENLANLVRIQRSGKHT